VPQQRLTIRRESTAHQVATVLRREVLAGRMAAGEPLREHALARQFEISRNTLREAIQVLVQEGLAERHLHRGAVVRRPTAQDVKDLLLVRSLVERAAVRAATGSPRPPDLRERLDAIHRAAAERDIAALVEADLDFHRRLIAAMDSPRLLAIFAGLETVTRLAIGVASALEVDPEAVAREHDELFEAIERGDAEDADRLICRHLDDAYERIEAALAQES
jgi:DNA-binding GntR family transcriptional regulator